MSAPATRPCVNCAVRINARAERCTLCGSEQPPRRRVLAALARYLPATLGVLLAGGLVATAVAVSGDSPSSDLAHRLFQVRSDMTLVTLVPENWQGGHVTAPPHVTREMFADPDQPGYSMTIEMRRHRPGSALGRARIVLAQIKHRTGYVLRSYNRATFPGGRGALLIEYEQSGVPHAIYLYSTCMPTVAMSVDVSAPTRAELAGPLSQLPASTGPRC